jgi:hypothetical protein
MRNGAFSLPLSLEARYWAGFLMGDGCVSYHGTGQMIVSLNQKASELEHIKKFRKFLESSATIGTIPPSGKTFAKSDLVQIAVASDRLAIDLIALGITPRKSHTAKVVDALALDPDFWRGLIDADGTLHMRTLGGKDHLPILQFGGSRFLADQFSELASCITEKTPKVCNHRTIFASGVSGKAAVHLANFLYYRNHCASLPRKLLLAWRFTVWERLRA